ncbi:unnamed protein product [Rotaria sp. Silwood1]|nr:unnamed protein product [Rotaria sp. Silwood1]
MLGEKRRLCLLSIILLFIRTLAYFLSCHITARSLHNQMFNSLLRAPVFFFDSNPIGRVVNRFSKDISSIDEQLTHVTYHFVDAFFAIISTIIFIASVQPLSLIPMALVGFVMARVRRLFAPAIQDIKRLESLTRSPIYSHLSSSIQGVIMIRSYGAQQICIQEFSHCLDEHTRVYSIMLAMTRWSALRIESVVAAFIGFLVFSILLTYQSLPISDLSLILAYSFTLVGAIQWVIRLTVDVMMQMTSAERVIEYIDLQPEESSNIKNLKILPSHWPIGGIIFDNLSFRYSSTSPWVLKNLNISIQPKEKVKLFDCDNADYLRVIGAGLGRTDTSSLKAALELLGFGPCHHMSELFDKPDRSLQFIRAFDGDKVDFHELMKGYGSTVDSPTSDFYKEIHKAYPKAKIVLTVRDSGEKWFESFQNTVGPVSVDNYYYFAVYLI